MAMESVGGEGVKVPSAKSSASWASMKARRACSALRLLCKLPAGSIEIDFFSRLPTAWSWLSQWAYSAAPPFADSTKRWCHACSLSA